MRLIKEETLLFKKTTQKAFDINGDGKIDFQDFKAIFTGQRYYKKSTLEQMSHRVKEIWTTNKHHFDVLAVNIKARQKTSRSFINKLLARHERKVEIVILRLLDTIAVIHKDTNIRPIIPASIN
jgi:EAL domain-containing protein (putative c-di-GMP-specific phosphodiesterase class I)